MTPPSRESLTAVPSAPRCCRSSGPPELPSPPDGGRPNPVTLLPPSGRSGVLACLVGLLGLLPASAGAQTPEREPLVVEIPASARAVGLGHVFQLDASDSDVIFFNPALLSASGGFALGAHRFGDASTALTASASTGWYDGVVGVGLRTLEYGTDRAAGERPGGIDPLLQDGQRAVSELVAVVAYGRELFGVRVGGAAKVVTQRFGSDEEIRGSFDVGVASRVGPFQAGLSVRNLGPDRVIDGTEADQPRTVTLGVGGYGQPVGPFDLGLASAVSVRADGEVVVGGGIEVGWWPIIGRTFMARVGARNVPEGDAFPVTFGGSFRGDDLVVDYAYQPVDDADGVHRITLGWR